MSATSSPSLLSACPKVLVVPGIYSSRLKNAVVTVAVSEIPLNFVAETWAVLINFLASLIGNESLTTTRTASLPTILLWAQIRNSKISPLLAETPSVNPVFWVMLFTSFFVSRDGIGFGGGRDLLTILVLNTYQCLNWVSPPRIL